MCPRRHVDMPYCNFKDMPMPTELSTHFGEMLLRMWKLPGEGRQTDKPVLGLNPHGVQELQAASLDTHGELP